MDDPAIESKDAFTVVGHQYEGAVEDGEIGELWDALDGWTGEFAALADAEEFFGVCTAFEESSGRVTYLAGVAADADAEVPDGMASVDLPARRYAVFSITLADLRARIDEIHGEWLPGAAYDRAEGPEFERYGEGYDGEPDTEFEYLVPVAPTD
ncbi:GyrI-like domain-containing protein [Halorarum halobium]|uniref:GyrI-like domain-containing protein n=1 Tax=Halorarum halobium TaxID=3075121 RepID=UPI0028B109BE|nr:GyrI-like domain-containing protein [Halobaculum sp. XH14]